MAGMQNISLGIQFLA